MSFGISKEFNRDFPKGEFPDGKICRYQLAGYSSDSPSRDVKMAFTCNFARLIVQDKGSVAISKHSYQGRESR